MSEFGFGEPLKNQVLFHEKNGPDCIREKRLYNELDPDLHYIVKGYTGKKKEKSPWLPNFPRSLRSFIR